MDPSTEEGGASLAESGQQSIGPVTTGLSHSDAGFFALQNVEVDAGEILEPPTNLDSTDMFGLPDGDTGYSPSVRTDFSGFMPESSFGHNLDVASDYNPETVVQAAWKSLSAETFKLPWGTWILGPVFGSKHVSHGHDGKGVQATFACTCDTSTESASSRENRKESFSQAFSRSEKFPTTCQGHT